MKTAIHDTDDEAEENSKPPAKRPRRKAALKSEERISEMANENDGSEIPDGDLKPAAKEVVGEEEDFGHGNGTLNAMEEEIIVSNGEVNLAVLFLNTSAGIKRVRSGAEFSKATRYLCSAGNLLLRCCCDSHGTPAFGSHYVRVTNRNDDNESNMEGWVCRNCQQLNGLLSTDEQRTLVNGNNDQSFFVADLPTGEACLGRDSCYDFAYQLSWTRDVIIHRRYIPTKDEITAMASKLFTVDVPGFRRGAHHYSARYDDTISGNIFDVLNENPTMRAIFDDIKKADGGDFYFVKPVLYAASNSTENEAISFVSHVDRMYKGKPLYRSNMTWDKDEFDVNVTGKVMRFQDRESGWWFDIHCINGTIVEQSHLASGIGAGGRIEHAIYNAEGKITITFDHGPTDC